MPGKVLVSIESDGKVIEVEGNGGKMKLSVSYSQPRRQGL